MDPMKGELQILMDVLIMYHVLIMKTYMVIDMVREKDGHHLLLKLT
jgi:hypothetical protein